MVHQMVKAGVVSGSGVEMKEPSCVLRIVVNMSVDVVHCSGFLLIPCGVLPVLSVSPPNPSVSVQDSLKINKQTVILLCWTFTCTSVKRSREGGAKSMHTRM